MQYKTPVVIVHFGDQLYVRKCLIETVRHNHNNVILIGDASNKHMCEDIGVKHVFVNDLPVSESRTEFISNFKNYSSNSHKFELLCFLRWFFILEFMNHFNINRLLHLDSDATLLCNASVFDDVAIGTSQPKQTSSIQMSNCIHTSIITRHYVQKFVNLCLDIYVSKVKFDLIAAKVEHHQTHPGGVCDMTLTYLLNKTENVTNLLEPDEHRGVIMNIIMCSGGDLGKGQYEMTNNIVSIFKQDDQYYLYDTIRKQYSLLRNIHFQGGAKRLLDKYDISTLPNIYEMSEHKVSY